MYQDGILFCGRIYRCLDAAESLRTIKSHLQDIGT